MNQFPPQPLSIPLGLFQIFSKIHGDIRKSRCTTGINDTGGKCLFTFLMCSFFFIAKILFLFLLVTQKLIGNYFDRRQREQMFDALPFFKIFFCLQWFDNWRIAITIYWRNKVGDVDRIRSVNYVCNSLEVDDFFSAIGRIPNSCTDDLVWNYIGAL